MHISDVIQRCLNEDRSAQNHLFRIYAPGFMSICQRYMKSIDLAEDVLTQAFFKIFTKISTYKGDGSFEGWMRRILVNECLMELRKRKNFSITIPLDELSTDPSVEFEDPLTYEEILSLLHELPDGYRTVFNLYVIEGYKHREIAEKLGISINTSKSQLILARRKVQKLIKKKFNIKTPAYERICG